MLPSDDDWQASVRRLFNSRIGVLDPSHRTVILRVDSQRWLPAAAGEYVGLGKSPPVVIELIDDEMSGGLLISDGDIFGLLPPFDRLQSGSSTFSQAPVGQLRLRRFLGSTMSVTFTHGVSGWVLIDGSSETYVECFADLDYTSHLEIVTGSRTVRSLLRDREVAVGDLDSLLDFGGILFEPSVTSGSVAQTMVWAISAYDVARSFNAAQLSESAIRADLAEYGGGTLRVVEAAGIDGVVVVECWARTGTGIRLLFQQLVAPDGDDFGSGASERAVIDMERG